MNAEYPAMYGKDLATMPGVLNDIRLTYTGELLDDVQFAPSGS